MTLRERLLLLAGAASFLGLAVVGVATLVDSYPDPIGVLAGGAAIVVGGAAFVTLGTEAIE